jgi:hypothetical protein
MLGQRQGVDSARVGVDLQRCGRVLCYNCSPNRMPVAHLLARAFPGGAGAR